MCDDFVLIVIYLDRKWRFEAPFGPQTWNCPHFKVQANYEVGLIPLNSTQNFKEKMFHQLLWTIDFFEITQNNLVQPAIQCQRKNQRRKKISYDN